jgi:hypothetical protein
MSEIWLKVLCPVRVSLLTDLVNVAPEKTFLRDGGSVELDGKTHRVLEFVVPEEFSASTELSSVDHIGEVTEMVNKEVTE